MDRRCIPILTKENTKGFSDNFQEHINIKRKELKKKESYYNAFNNLISLVMLLVLIYTFSVNENPIYVAIGLLIQFIFNLYWIIPYWEHGVKRQIMKPLIFGMDGIFAINPLYIIGLALIFYQIKN
jgi:hypothetical protein